MISIGELEKRYGLLLKRRLVVMDNMRNARDTVYKKLVVTLSNIERDIKSFELGIKERREQLR